MEGKEVRFGIVNSAIWATATTDASNGSVDAMHDSFTPLGGLVPLFNLHLGEVVFGGVGTGLAGMIVMAVLTVFIAGLMVGRTPEYLGKKIQAREMKLAMLYILIFAAVILLPTAVAVLNKGALSSMANPGPHGFSRNSLCVFIGRREQRISIRWSECQYHVLQFLARVRDVVRAVRNDDSGVGDRRFARGKEGGPSERGHVSYQWD